jgi:hypothetical protein
VTGTDVATVRVRSWSRLGAAGAVSGNTSPMRGQLADFVVKKNTWTRYWVVFELNQGAPWSCGTASGRYDLVSLWVADELQAPVRLYAQAEVETTRLVHGTGELCSGDETFSSPLADGIIQFWLEYGVAGNGDCVGGASRDQIGYVRNVALLHGPEESLYLGDATLVGGGTELLVRPRP